MELCDDSSEFGEVRKQFSKVTGEPLSPPSSTDHTILAGGVVCCTLGHGIEDNDVISHEYYGSMTKIIEDLKPLGFETGLVVLRAHTDNGKSSGSSGSGMSTSA